MLAYTDDKLGLELSVKLDDVRLPPDSASGKYITMKIHRFNVQLSRIASVKRQSEIADVLALVSPSVELVPAGIEIQNSGSSSLLVTYRSTGEPLSADDIERIEKALLSVPWVLAVESKA